MTAFMNDQRSFVSGVHLDSDNSVTFRLRVRMR
ncbi:MAG: hypothetical protein K0R67_2802 [Paenibacillus sp.]|nr:hypothetical protein [Paenibacillus sp.]